jgi:FlaA1/EpsC-like NDP-sugar epimerase
MDLVVFMVAIVLAKVLQLNQWNTAIAVLFGNLWPAIIFVVSQSATFHLCGVYRPILRYSNTTFLRSIGKAIALNLAMVMFLRFGLVGWNLGISSLIIASILILVLTLSLRLFLIKYIRFYQRQRSPVKSQRLLIYGAGQAGSELLQMLGNNPKYRIIAFIDDNPDLHHRTNLNGYPVYSYSAIETLWAHQAFDLVVLALPSVDPKVRGDIVKRLQQLAIPVKTVPSLGDMLSGQVKINQIRDVDIGDLLGREQVAPDLTLLRQQTHDRVVLVTGAGGSIGSELCRQIILQRPRSLVLYELNEFALYQIHQELTEAYPDTVCVPYLGSVADESYLGSVLRQHGVEVVYHAAAYKHVPLLESNIIKGVENNVRGTFSAARSAIANGVDQFVLISTDKAVRPTNIMGTTKRVAELIIQALAAQPEISTCFTIVRFGNVLGSSGSVVPRFQAQIAKGGPVTLTHPEITRYFMSIPEAARLVIQAGALAQGGEVFLLDMGEPVKILDLAIQMIRLSGLVPEQDIAIKITGTRPGEKIYEELLIAGDNIQPTRHKQIYSSQEPFIPWVTLEPLLTQLLQAVCQNDPDTTYALLRRLVPEYTAPDHQAAQAAPPIDPDQPCSALAPAHDSLPPSAIVPIGSPMVGESRFRGAH